MARMPGIDPLEPPPGWVPAVSERDYTLVLPLRGEEVLVLSLLTGFYWRGPESASTDAVTDVSMTDNSGAGFSPENEGKVAQIMGRFDAVYQTSLTGPNRTGTTSLVLIPSYKCNLWCDYCYEGKLTAHSTQWTPDQAVGAIRGCAQALESHGLKLADTKVTLLGGEVVRADIMDTLDAIFHELHIQKVITIEVVTNGFELAQYGSRLKNGGVTSVMVTIDGPQDIHDLRRQSRHTHESSYARAMAGISAVLELGMRVSLRINIDDRNVAFVPAFLETVNSLGWLDHSLFSAYLYPIGNDFRGSRTFLSERQLAHVVADLAISNPLMKRIRWDFHGLDILYRIRDGRPLHPRLTFCGAERNQVVADLTGNLYSCWFGIGSDVFRIGRIDTATEEGTIDTERVTQWQNRVVSRMAYCATCRWALLCGGGCAFKAYDLTGKISGPSCADFKEILYDCAPHILDN